jgi:Flp pilus assembly protein TadD
VNDAYWWAREAILRDANFAAAYNTLGVIYRRHGDLAAATQAFRHVLARAPEQVQAMSNLLLVLQDQGRSAEAQQLAAILARKQPYPPYHFFDLAQKAMAENNFKHARELFAREVRRQPYNAEFHYGLASAYLALGDETTALRHFVLAYDTSTTHKQQALYAAKVARIHARTEGKTIH